jgi:hypothetical protein
VLGAPATARADDAQALEWAKSPFDTGQYLLAHERLSAILDVSRPIPCADGSPTAAGGCKLTAPELIERARALDAASLLALKRDTEADQRIATILRQNPNFIPSPAVFPQEVIDRFNTVRLALGAELRAIAEQQEARRAAEQKLKEDTDRWIAELERLASREKVIVPNSRWIALVPFGIGQFQNGNKVFGGILAGLEAATGGVSLLGVVEVNYWASKTPSQTSQIDPINAYIKTWTAVNRGFFGAWAALTLAGVVQAQIAFVPERITYLDRPIPPRPKLVPIAAPVPRGAVLGLGGTF